MSLIKYNWKTGEVIRYQPSIHIIINSIADIKDRLAEASGYNPRKLSNVIVGAYHGWRLLTEYEKRNCRIPKDVEWYVGGEMVAEWLPTPHRREYLERDLLCWNTSTYRTKEPEIKLDETDDAAIKRIIQETLLEPDSLPFNESVCRRLLRWERGKSL